MPYTALINAAQHGAVRAYRVAIVAAVVALLALIVSLSANVIGLTTQKRSIAANGNAIGEIQRSRRSARLDNAATHEHACRQIEALKQGFRDDAILSYENLARNLRLLHVEATPEIVQIAEESRDSKLRRYAPLPGGTEADPYAGCSHLPTDVPQVSS